MSTGDYSSTLVELTRVDRIGRACLALSTVREPKALGIEPAQILDPAEMLNWRRMSPPRQFTFLAGRWIAKRAVSELTGAQDLRSIQIESGVFGQPLLKVAGLSVSISHCAAMTAALAFPDEQPMGVDVELPARVTAANVLSMVNAAEVKLAQTAGLDEVSAAALLWSAREALGKVLRCGLTVPLEILGIDSLYRLQEGVFRLEYRNFPQYQCRCWLWPELVFALVLPGRTEVSDIGPFLRSRLECFKAGS